MVNFGGRGPTNWKPGNGFSGGMGMGNGAPSMTNWKPPAGFGGGMGNGPGMGVTVGGAPQTGGELPPFGNGSSSLTNQNPGYFAPQGPMNVGDRGNEGAPSPYGRGPVPLPGNRPPGFLGNPGVPNGQGGIGQGQNIPQWQKIRQHFRGY